MVILKLSISRTCSGWSEVEHYDLPLVLPWRTFCMHTSFSDQPRHISEHLFLAFWHYIKLGPYTGKVRVICCSCNPFYAAFPFILIRDLSTGPRCVGHFCDYGLILSLSRNLGPHLSFFPQPRDCDLVSKVTTNLLVPELRWRWIP